MRESQNLEVFLNPLFTASELQELQAGAPWRASCAGVAAEPGLHHRLRPRHLHGPRPLACPAGVPTAGRPPSLRAPGEG